MPRGGYQKPSKPAAASGPGRKSQRTDGGPAQKMRELPNAQYGEAQTFRDLQSGAPLASAQSAQAAPGPQGPSQPITPFNAPTQRPDEPGTAGNPLGAGPGPEALGVGSGPLSTVDMSNLTSMLPVLIEVANGPNGTPALRNLVRYLKGRRPG